MNPETISLCIIFPISSIDGNEFNKGELYIFLTEFIWYLNTSACIPARTRNQYDERENIMCIYKLFSTAVPEDEKPKIKNNTREIKTTGLRIKPM